MSYEENLKSRTLDADASVGIYTGVPGQPGSAVPNTGMQYRALRLTGTHQCGLCAAGREITADLANGDKTITATDGAFTDNDIGRAVTGTGAASGAVIASVTDETHAEMDKNAASDQTGTTLTLGGFGVDGVLQNKPQRPGAAAQVGYQGVTKVMTGGSFAAGVEIVPDATGRFVAGTQSAAGLRFKSEAPSPGAGVLVPASIS